MRRTLIVLTLAGAAFAALRLAAPDLGAKDEETESIDAKMVDDAARLMTTVWKLRGRACGVGSPTEKAKPFVDRAAGYYFTSVLPLAKTPYALGDRSGVVEFDLTEEKGRVDEVRISLPTGRYDVKAVRARLLAVARGLGVALERDEDRADCWSAVVDDGWLCFSLGDGVVRIEASL